MTTPSDLARLSAVLHRPGTMTGVVCTAEGANKVAEHLESKGWRLESALPDGSVRLGRQTLAGSQQMLIERADLRNGALTAVNYNVTWIRAGHKPESLGTFKQTIGAKLFPTPK